MKLSKNITIEQEKRPCIVNGKRGIFHGFTKKDSLIAPSALKGGHNGGIVSVPGAIIEFENGTVEIWKPEEIRFCDSAEQFCQYDFENMKKPKAQFTEYPSKKLEEFNKLKDYLFKEKIDFEERHCFAQFVDCTPVKKEIHRIAAIDDRGRIIWDAICHKGSYGAEQGLLEIRGSIVRGYPEGGEVKGYLTAAEVIERINGIVVQDLKE